MKNTEATPTTNKCGTYEQMMARLAAKEAKIEANHKRYLEIMAHYNKAQGR
jgi:hypothetical protein